MDGWKTSFFLGWLPGRWYVSFTECFFLKSYLDLLVRSSERITTIFPKNAGAKWGFTRVETVKITKPPNRGSTGDFESPGTKQAKT